MKPLLLTALLAALMAGVSPYRSDEQKPDRGAQAKVARQADRAELLHSQLGFLEKARQFQQPRTAPEQLRRDARIAEEMRAIVLRLARECPDTPLGRFLRVGVRP
jgi:hypothetical protein